MSLTNTVKYGLVKLHVPSFSQRDLLASQMCEHFSKMIHVQRIVFHGLLDEP